MFAAFRQALPGIPLLANMTEFGRSPSLGADQLAALGYDMVIWPVSSLRVANKAQQVLYQTLAETGSTQSLLGQMQTRAELYDTIDLPGYESLDRSIIRTVLPNA